MFGSGPDPEEVGPVRIVVERKRGSNSNRSSPNRSFWVLERNGSEVLETHPFTLRVVSRSAGSALKREECASFGIILNPD